jgi:hypothetical protein
MECAIKAARITARIIIGSGLRRRIALRAGEYV